MCIEIGFYIGLATGLFIGTSFGFLLCALMVMAKKPIPKKESKENP